MFRKQIICSITIILILGCEEPINWQLSKSMTDLVVVEAVLTNENKNQLIKLSRPYAEQNMIPETVSGAVVIISTIDGSYPALENPPGSGLYFTDSLIAVIDKLYTISIDFDGQTYFAEGEQSPGEALDQISYRESSDGMFTLNFNSSGTEANYVKYYLSWQETGNCPNNDSCEALQIFYDLKNVDVIEQFKPNQELVEFPEGTTIIRKKYSVSDEYREYLRGMLSETSWRGGLFDVFPANAATNLSTGAIGFFAVSTVVSDTTIVVKK